MNKISRFAKLVLFSSAFALIAVSSLRASEEEPGGGGSCQPPKDTICGSSGGPFIPYGNYTPNAD
jgi:hypothetical protein